MLDSRPIDVNDDTYAAIMKASAADHVDPDFADAWYKLVNRSEDKPNQTDLERKFGI